MRHDNRWHFSLQRTNHLRAFVVWMRNLSLSLSFSLKWSLTHNLSRIVSSALFHTHRHPSKPWDQSQGVMTVLAFLCQTLQCVCVCGVGGRKKEREREQLIFNGWNAGEEEKKRWGGLVRGSRARRWSRDTDDSLCLGDTDLWCSGGTDMVYVGPREAEHAPISWWCHCIRRSQTAMEETSLAHGFEKSQHL